MDLRKFPSFSAKRKPLVTGNKVFKSITDFQVTDEELEKACVELGETDKKRSSCVEELKRKLSKDQKVRYRTEDAYLLRFLRVRKFDCDRAYHHVKDFYYLKKNKPEFFNVPKNLKNLLDRKFYNVLPYTDEEGNLIFSLEFENWKLDEMSFEEVSGSSFVANDIISMNPRCQVNGAVLIADVKGMRMNHITESLKKNRLPTYLSLVQSSYPWRVKRVIVLNCGNIAQLGFSIVRPLLTKKIRERFVLLGSDMNELHQYVNPAILPKKYGGQLEEEECTISDLIIENLPYVEYERSFC